MIYERTSEGYAQYLQSGHWKKLRAFVLRRDGGKCVRCGSTDRLQAHHKLYRDDWESALASDLETLCRSCHEKQHPDKQVVKTAEVYPPVNPSIGTRKEIETARSMRQISRAQYLELREKLTAMGQWNHKRKRKWVVRKKTKKRRRRPILGYQGCKPWHYSVRRVHWVNRGTSSN